jgi:DNA polymerase (family 10)
MHTTKSDGKDTVEEMAREAKELNYEYIAITEHSKAVRVAGGLDEEELLEWIESLDEKDEAIEGIKILKGIEVDILENGDLDLDEEVLKRLDIVVAAVHSHFSQSKEKMTERIIKGLKNPIVNVLAHPTGRLINKRKPYKVDMQQVLKAAKDYNVYPEVNAHPARLDLKDIHCRMAKEMDLKVIINTDAHRVSELLHMRFGVDTARRGWLENKDILNTKSCEDLLKIINV